MSDAGDPSGNGVAVTKSDTTDLRINGRPPKGFHIAAADAASWMADVDDFTDQVGFPRQPFADEEGNRRLPSDCVTGTTRIDFSPFEIPVEGGDPRWHVNVTLSEASGNDASRHTGRYLVVAQAITAWFGPKPLTDHDTPDDELAAYEVERRRVHTTDRGSKIIDPPVVAPKRVRFNG